MAKYKLIDGQLYEVVTNTNDLKNQVNSLITQLKPYKEKSTSIDNQIAAKHREIENLKREKENVTNQINQLKQRFNIDADLVKAIAGDSFDLENL